MPITAIQSQAMLLDVAALIREVSRTEIMPRFRNLGPGEAREKGPGDWVTVADESAERALRTGLAAMLPDAVTVGEEEVAADAAVLGRLGRPEPAWIIDPVDGTRLFRDGEPGFGVILALATGGRTVMGWILDCVSGYLACAGCGIGAFQVTGERLLRLTRDAAPGHGTANWPFFAGARMRRVVAPAGSLPARLSTCSTADYLAIARGDSAFNIATHSKPWDHAAGALIACELGGAAQDLDGSPYCVAGAARGVCVSIDGNLAHQVRSAYLPLLAA